tara:strand:- start:4533 stop:7541 length:3009 start_codon:yes stop_codon:yes gene_type:complete
MGTVFRNPHWLIPNNSNRDKVANYSLDFDSASSSYITVDNSSGIFSFGTNPFSISLWFNGESFPGAYTALLGSHGSGSNSSFWGVYVHDTVGVVIFHGGQLIGGGGSISTNQWYHYAVTRDSAGNLITYLNGAVVNTATGKTGTFNSSSAIRIGDDLHNANPSFNGKLCQISIFNYALQQEDITTLYGNSTSGVGDPLLLNTPPVAYYPLGDELVYNGSSFLVPNMVGSNIGSSNFLCTEFDGANDSIDCSSYLNFKNTAGSQKHNFLENDWVVSYWMKSSSIGDLRNITGGQGFFQYSNTYYGGKLRFYNGIWVDVQGSANLEDNQWHHIAIQCEGGTTHRCYIDGVQTYENTGSAFSTTGFIDTIGSYSGGGIRFYQGKLSQLAMFNASNISISDLYNGGVQPNILNFNNLVFLADLGKDAQLLTNGLYYKDAIQEEFYPSKNFSWEALRGDSPNGSSASGVGLSIPSSALKSQTPYSNNNIISSNSEGFSQLIPFGANQAAVADTSKMNILVQPGLYEAGGLTCKIRVNTVSAGSTIDWGDGSGAQTLVNGLNTHTYSTSGIYNVKLSGTFAPYQNSDIYGLNLINLTHFGDDVVFPNMYLGFRLCTNLDITAFDTPTIGANASLGYCFQNNMSLVNANGSIRNWDVSNTSTTWQAGFQNARRFNVDISSWNPPSNVNLANFFQSCKSFNQPIGNWNISPMNVSACFYQAHKFNQPLTNWTIPANLSQMFRQAIVFNSFPGTPAGTFTNLYYTFQGADAFNQDISSWDVSGVTNFVACFQSADAFNQPIGNWTINTSGANVNMDAMFYTTPAFNQDISTWDMSEVSSISQFGAYNSSGTFPVPGITSNKITNLQLICRRTPSNASWFTSIDYSNVTSIYYAFDNNNLLNQDFGDVDISSLTNATAAFFNCTSFSTSNVTSTLTKWAIKVYNGNGNTGVNAASIFYGRTFDNSQTSDTAGNAFTWPAGSGWSNAGDAFDWLISSTGGNWSGVTTGLTRIN